MMLYSLRSGGSGVGGHGIQVLLDTLTVDGCRQDILPRAVSIEDVVSGDSQQLAMPGSILITGDTLRLAEGYVHAKALGPMTVKGLSEPVDVYEVTGSGAVRSRLQAAAARRFVGRDAELAQLRRALEQARQGRGQVVAIVGEPGVGKSRLVFLHSLLPGLESRPARPIR